MPRDCGLWDYCVTGVTVGVNQLLVMCWLRLSIFRLYFRTLFGSISSAMNRWVISSASTTDHFSLGFFLGGGFNIRSWNQKQNWVQCWPGGHSSWVRSQQVTSSKPGFECAKMAVQPHIFVFWSCDLAGSVTLCQYCAWPYCWLCDPLWPVSITMVHFQWLEVVFFQTLKRCVSSLHSLFLFLVVSSFLLRKNAPYSQSCYDVVGYRIA